LIAEEALRADTTQRLLDWLHNQPQWSDLPLLILTTGAADEAASARIVHFFGSSVNVTLLERPLRSLTLVSAVQTALRARQRQHEVRRLIAQREMLLASISDGFSALDANWRYIYVNQRIAELAGRAREEMIGRTIWEVFPDAVGTAFYDGCHRVMRDKKPEQFELYYEPLQRWLETRIYPSEDGIVIFRADITGRKRDEERAREATAKLRESEDRLRLATEAAAIGTFDYYPATGDLQLSDRAKEVLGFSPDDAVSYDDYRAAFHPDDRHIVSETVARVLEPQGSDHYEIEYRTISRTSGTERWVAEKGRVLFDEAGRPARFIGTVLDITGRKNAEILLERAKREAEQANRAKDQFLAMLSHELRTPLTPVLMTIASLRRDPTITDSLQHDLEVLQRNVELEALLIDDLLDLTRIAHGKLELHYDAVDIHGSLEHALNISRKEIEEKHLTLRRNFDAAEHHCWADTARIQQVFWNLVKNAVKFTPAGGSIEVRTRNEDGHQLVVEISDDGIGIQPALLPRIFDAFEQGGRTMTSAFGGLGLGLAISKRVIDLHGGSITARSEGPNRGATFTVTLQAMATSLLDTPVVYLPTEPQRGDARILLVEDHEDTARVLRRILEHAGYRVTHAASIAAAREAASGEAFDLVISDLGLPDGSGLDLMRFLRAHHGLTGIALSGFGTEDDLAASSAAGFTEHLTKPADWPQLRSAIERSLAVRPANPLTEAVGS
jgi:PAS domain S-box-containing protein